jgi:DNA-binding NarL/FixJ family response regulator
MIPAQATGNRQHPRAITVPRELWDSVTAALSLASLDLYPIPADGSRRDQFEIAARPSTRTGQPLADRELQVLRGMSQGKTNGQIGQELYLSEDTVKTHARRLYRKLGAHDRAHAVDLGWRAGWLR